MGNTTGALMEVIQLRALSDAARDQTPDSCVQTAFRWDPNDCSPNLTVADEGQIVIRNGSGDSFDAVKTRAAFLGGIHVWEIHWSKTHYGRHARIGIMADTSTPLVTNDAKKCLGMNSSSYAWDLHTGQLLHNAKIENTYPKSRGDTIPSVILVVINMEKSPATLSFYSNDHKLLVEFDTLDCQKECMYPAISTSQRGSRVRINYIGGSESILGFSQGILPVITFHDVQAGGLNLSHNLLVASHSSSEPGGVICTNRPLASNELFEVSIDSTSVSRDDSLIFGVTTNEPSSIQDVNNLNQCRQGDIWMYDQTSIKHISKGKAKVLQEINFDLKDLEEGHLVGVRVTSDSRLMFYTNNACQTSIKITSNNLPLYVVYEMKSRVTRLKINDPDYMGLHAMDGPPGHGCDAHQVLKHAMDAVESLRTKDPGTMKCVKEKVLKHLHETLLSLESHRHSCLLASVLTEIGCPELMTGYIRFLEKCNMGNPLVWLCYETISSVCMNFADESIPFSIALAKAGLLRVCTQTVVNIRSSYRDSESKTKNLKTSLSILHNCSKVAENRAYYHTYDVIKHVSSYLDTDLHSPDIAMRALFTMSFIYVDAEINRLMISASLLDYILVEYRKAIENRDGHRSLGYYVNEFTVALTNLAANHHNCEMLLNKDGMGHFLRLLSLGNVSEQENALNAISEYTIGSTQQKVARTPGLLEKLEYLKDSEDEALCQGADRCLLKLKEADFLRTSVKVDFQNVCPYWEKCQRFKVSLGLPGHLFTSSFDMCFCSLCHAKRGDKPHYIRGRPAKRYSMPVGWCRFALVVPQRAKAQEVYSKWHRAFYGTRCDSVGDILRDGQIASADMDRGKMLVCSGQIDDDAISKGFQPSQIMLSPSVRYAGCDVNAKPTNFTDEETGEDYNARVVICVFIKPGSYLVGPQTLGARQQIDPSFSNQELVWATRKSDSIILYGLLVKLDEPGYYRQILRD